jgi:hypothetical protein
VSGDDQHADRATPGRDFHALPPAVRLDETVTSVDPGPVPDPHADRNLDQHLALRDD